MEKDTTQHNERNSWWRIAHHLVDLMQQSGLGEVTVLRGSLLMKAWYGQQAREPNDMDWVLRDPEMRFSERFLLARIADFLRLVRKYPEVGGVHIRSRKISDAPLSKGEYARLVGHRLQFPWDDAAKNTGIVQIDIAFDEILRVEPSLTTIPNPFGKPTEVYAAGKDESLAWKLLWLQRDAGRNKITKGKPQGKDLYDAVLLAEDTFLPLDLYLLVTGWFGREILPGYASDPYHNHDFPLMWDVEWEPFQEANPQVVGTAIDWQMRLAYALEPTFTDEGKERAQAALSHRPTF